MRFSRFILALLFILTLSPVISAQEITKLSDDTEIYGYQTTPPIKPIEKCDKYALIKKGKDFQFLSDGIRKVSTGITIMVRKGCLFPRTGVLKLNNGKSIEMYQEKIMNDDGELVFWAGTMNALPNGHYQLKKGTKFEIVDGHIPEGYYDKKTDDILIEDRD